MNPAITDEELVAFMHGELDDGRALAVEEAINADPDLAERAAKLDRQDDLVRQAFAPILNAPIPAAMRDTVLNGAPSATILSFDAAKAQRATQTEATVRRQWGWPQFGAMAASLAIGLIAGPALLNGNASSTALVVASADGPTVPGSLAAMLDTAASGEQIALGDLGTAQVDLTFRSNDQALCRQVQVQQGSATSDLVACRSGSTWQVEALGQRAAAAGDIRTASGDAAPGVVAAVDAIIASDPLVGDQERAALRR